MSYAQHMYQLVDIIAKYAVKEHYTDNGADFEQLEEIKRMAKDLNDEVVYSHAEEVQEYIMNKSNGERKMNAKEMFEECGYIKIENANTIEFSRSDEDYIYFEKEKKLIGIGFYKINVNTLEAINKQCEELGWMQSHAK